MTYLPSGHRSRSSTRTLAPPSWMSRVAHGSGTQAPSMVPARNVSSVWAFSWGTTETSPPPAVSVVRPCSLSQDRSATSWVLPSDGLAIFLPLRSAALAISGLTTRKAPPEVEPEMTRTASPFDFANALMAGLGPMYVMSSASANIASTAGVPELKGVIWMSALGRSFLRGPSSARATRPGACVMLGNTPNRTVTASVNGARGPPAAGEAPVEAAGVAAGAAGVAAAPVGLAPPPPLVHAAAITAAKARVARVRPRVTGRMRPPVGVAAGSGVMSCFRVISTELVRLNHRMSGVVKSAATAGPR